MSTTTTVLERKLNRGFDMLAGGRTELSEDTFADLGNRLARAYPQTPPEKLDRLRSAFHTIWTRYLGSMDTNGDGVVDRAEFINGWQNSLQSERDQLVADFTTGWLAWMDIADTNNNKLIERDEFLVMFTQPLGLPADQVNEAFDKLDRNGDQVLDQDELTKAVREYWTSDDPDAPGNWLHGSID